MLGCATYSPTEWNLERKIATDCMLRLHRYKTKLILFIIGGCLHINADCFGEFQSQSSSLNLENLQLKVSESLGLRSAIVSVGLEHASSNELFIPWRNNEQPSIKVALPLSWLKKRSEQVGSQETALASLREIIDAVAPGSKVTFQVVQDAPVTIAPQVNQESYTKPIAMAIGLIAILVSGFYYDRRRTAKDVVIVQHSTNSKAEAKRILKLNFHAAKHAMDALEGSRQQEVLRAIVESECFVEETPVIQVQQREPSTAN